MKDLIDIFQMIWQSGLLVIIIAFLWSYCRPLIEAKIKTAKSARERENLQLLEKVADNAVSALVGRNDLSGSDKFKEAQKQATDALAKAGVQMNDQAVATAVQSAYEKSPLTPTAPLEDQSLQEHQGLVTDNG